MKSIPEILAEELGQKLEYVQNVVNLMDEGNTIPFIARYRKEMHGAMDDTTLRNLETRLTYLRNLQERRDEVKKSIENQGKLTQELSDAIDSAATMAEVEDLYRPYKQKRRTRGSIAREKGLAPLAEAIFAQDGQDPAVLAEGYIDPEKGVNSVEEALQGANDIIAEDLSDDADIRKSLRELVMRRGMLTCTAAEDADSGSTAARARIEAEPESPMGAAISPPLWGQNVGELLAVKRVESSFPSAEAVRLNGLSLNFHLVEEVIMSAFKLSRNGNIGKHRSGAASGCKNAVIFQNELCIKLSHFKCIAGSNANNRPTFAKLINQIVSKYINILSSGISGGIGIYSGNHVHAVAHIDSGTDVGTVYASVVNSGVFGQYSTRVNSSVVVCLNAVFTGRPCVVGLSNGGLIEGDSNITEREGIGCGVLIGEVRQRAADDQHRDEHDCDRSHQNGFLFHK